MTVELYSSQISNFAQDLLHGGFAQPKAIKNFGNEILSKINVEEILLDYVHPTNVHHYVDNVLKPVSADTLDRFGNLTQTLDESIIEDFERTGGTLILTEIDESNKTISNLSSAVRSSIPGRTWANFFFTAFRDGIKAHWDDNDVFALQTLGSRIWEFWEPCPPLPIATSRQVNADPDSPPHLSIRLDPGDLLILPRGWIHRTKLVGTMSAHVMIAFRCPTVVDLLQHALNRAAINSVELREYVTQGGIELDQKLTSALETLQSELRSDDALYERVIASFRTPTLKAAIRRIVDKNS